MRACEKKALPTARFARRLRSFVDPAQTSNTPV
jgi:hypothetical protein